MRTVVHHPSLVSPALLTADILPTDMLILRSTLFQLLRTPAPLPLRIPALFIVLRHSALCPVVLCPVAPKYFYLDDNQVNKGLQAE